MGVPIDRHAEGGVFALDGSLKTPIAAIPGKAGGGLIALADWGGDSASFEVGVEADVLNPLYDGAGALVSVQVIADTAVAIPEDAMKFRYIRIVAAGIGAAEGQGVGLVFKS